jgi:hypothetical protein
MSRQFSDPDYKLTRLAFKKLEEDLAEDANKRLIKQAMDYNQSRRTGQRENII